MLSELVDQLLERLEEEGAGPRGRRASEHPAGGGPEQAPDLEEPIEPEFRVGRMAIGYDPARDLVLLQCDELTGEELEEPGEFEDPLSEALEEEREGATARFWATRQQMRALGRRGAEVVAAGRPVCPMCGGPIDPEGHFCPSSNGHRETDDLP